MIKQYRENRKTVDGLYAELSKKRDAKAATESEIYQKYADLKFELDKKEREETHIVNEAFEVEETKIKESIAKHSEIIDQVKRILAFKGIAKNHPEPGSLKVETYGDKFLELIDTIKTPCLELRAYIYENDKPKNKYALVAIGESIFGRNEALGKFPRSYGLYLNEHGADITIHFKDAPTVEKLKEYYSKNKSKLLNDFLAQHHRLEGEYAEVRANCNTPKWERLYWEDRKEYYEERYSGGTETDEYKAVLKELKKLNLPSRLLADT